jgi:deoxyuridine 5'-triphosphate nucleotidohydrolase
MEGATTTIKRPADLEVPLVDIKFIISAHGTPQYPFKAYPNDAGWDVSVETKHTKYTRADPMNDVMLSDAIVRGVILIEPGETKVVGTGVQMHFPNSWFGQLVGRSSNNARGLMVATGTIDPKYRGEVGVVLTNLGPSTVEVVQGDRVAQLLILPLLVPGLVRFTRCPMIKLYYESPDGAVIPEDLIANADHLYGRARRRESRGEGGFGSSNGPVQGVLERHKLIPLEAPPSPYEPEHEYTRSFQHDLDGTCSDDDVV